MANDIDKSDKRNLLEITESVLLSFDEIHEISLEDEYIMFWLKESEYKIFPPQNELTGYPMIFQEHIGSSRPHVIPIPLNVNGERVGSLCLFEAGSVVGLYQNYEERVINCIERLIELVNLSWKDQVSEFQNEFLYHWNNAAATSVKNSRKHQQRFYLFLNHETETQWLNAAEYQNDVVRLYSDDISFNDWRRRSSKTNGTNILYLPLVDIENIVPPTEDKPWGPEQIYDIICGLQNQRITSETYHSLMQKEFGHKNVFLVLKLNNYCFGCLVEFSSGAKMTFTKKIETQIERVIPIRIKRTDFSYINKAIGNEGRLLDKRIAIIGAGSLGSYIAEELLHSGIKQFVIVDNDFLEPENIMRHRMDFAYDGINKAKALAFRLECIHPEVVVLPIDNRIGYKDCLSIIPIDVDLVIFAVGTTDTQINCNRYLAKESYSKPVLYAWLEGDGESSHVAVVRYDLPGCFECLFTNEIGEYCECIINKSNDIEPTVMRNGCGGTRVAYGNSTLLSASKIVVEAVSMCFNEVTDNYFTTNFIISFINRHIQNAILPVNKLCKCCGTKMTDNVDH